MKIIHANYCECTRCGRPAAAFWPLAEPCIPSCPFCLPCLAVVQAGVLRRWSEQVSFTVGVKPTKGARNA